MTAEDCIFSCVSIGSDVNGIIVPAFWFKGFAIHPAFRLLRDDDNEMQYIASCLATTKLEDLLAEFVKRDFVLVFSNIALCGVSGADC